jgi:hypothetical protein
MSVIGALFPITLFGLSSLWSLPQFSNLRRASLGVRSQRGLRHSARSRPLNASIDAFSVGLLGRPKSSVTLLRSADA